MRAVTVNDYGETPVLTELSVGAGGRELIEVAAAGVNPMDRAIANGL